MKKDVPNIIIKNVLNKEEIKDIYNIVDNTSNKSFQEDLSYTSWHIQLPIYLIDKITKVAESIANEKLILKEYNLSRYHKAISDCKTLMHNPLLHPHTDEAFNSKRFTLDLQLESNVSWDIVVDNWKSEQVFTLKDNEALTFSGTHQVHWRPKREFEKGEYLDMLFMHFAPLKNDAILSEEHKDEMRARVKEKSIIWQNLPGISKNPVEGKY
jgi:hypothetical protein